MCTVPIVSTISETKPIRSHYRCGSDTSQLHWGLPEIYLSGLDREITEGLPGKTGAKGGENLARPASKYHIRALINGGAPFTTILLGAPLSSLLSCTSGGKNPRGVIPPVYMPV